MADPEESPSRLRGTLAPLGISSFRNLMVSNTLWWQSMRMEEILIGWLVLELTNSAWQVAVVGFFRSIPWLITGLIAGPLANRLGRIQLSLIAQGISILVVVTITLLLWTDRLALWHLWLGVGISGTCWSLNWTARRALMPDLVGKARVVDAVLLESFASNISRVVGPFLGGALIAALGATGCYAAVTGVSTASFLIMLRVRSPKPSRQASKASPWALMVEGLKYMRHNQPILGALLITVIMNYLVFPHQTLLPVFARDVLGQGPVGLGMLGAGSGVGAFVGLYIVNRLRSVLSRGWIFSIGSIFMALMLFAFSFSTDFQFSIALLILAGLGHACFSVMQSAIVLTSTEDHMRDRAMGALVLAIGTGPIGRLQIGHLAESFNAPVALSFHAAAAACLVLVATAALPGFRKRLD
ncbi:MAG: MFS transporter [bacterium]|nr:MFS transporter [bacterium]